MGSVYNDDRDDWTGSGEKRVSGSWRRWTGATALTKRLHRKQMAPFFSKPPRRLIAMEACGTAHYWARTLAAMGHEVRLIPPTYVKAYVKRGKSDA
jgi:transposase